MYTSTPYWKEHTPMHTDLTAVSPRKYFQVAATGLIGFTLIPVAYGVSLMMPDEPTWGGTFDQILGMALVALSAVVLVGWLGLVWATMNQPTFRQALLVGFGVPIAVPAVLVFLDVMDPDGIGTAVLVLALPVAPVVLGTAVLHGRDGRRLLARAGLVLAAVGVPVLLWVPNVA
jgi:hypothetical protein